MGDDVAVSREQALAHRWFVQGLDRSTSAKQATELDVWELGLQESPAGSAELALAARLRGGLEDVPNLADGRRFTTAWATRGAPLLMRVGDVTTFAQGLWPVDEADAVARLGGNGQQLRKAGVDPFEAIRTTGKEMRSILTKAKRPMTKGEVSEAVTKRIPADYSTWCRGCQATHVGELIMRLAALPAGLRLEPDTSPATLAPISGWKALPKEPTGADAIVRAYLHLYGPATPGDVGAFLQTSAKAAKAAWPEDLAEVTVDGKKAWLPEEDLDALEAADPSAVDVADPDTVRLLPRSDPWLLARDRERIVPGAADRKVLWPVINWPGAVLAGTEVIGTWKAKAAKAKQPFTIEVSTFGPLPKPIRAAIEREAEAVAAQRDADTHTVTFT